MELLVTKNGMGMETFLIKNRTRGMQPFFNWERQEWEDCYSTQNGTERNENGTIKKEEREWNDLAEGPRSRTERNDFKKSDCALP